MVERDFVYPKWDEDKEDPRVDNLINALYGDLGRWRWKPADWNPQGVLVKNPKPPELRRGKDPQTLEMKCRRGSVLRAFPLLKMASVASRRS
ncbi:unnamed protein product [Microthlaspi erraticum]|uniref:Uncharacterized protein n=1 Tax=Microthlaspi erraticum TaxID=1685480 RepID=A0A6D2KWI0_9BRAS|nr:unnamed protein product [Microthlaspi erraticum]